MQRFRHFALVTAVYLGTFMATLDISIVNVALPTMQRSLQTDLHGLQWIIDAYALCLSAFMLSAGAIGDRYGRKKSWLLGIAVFTLGSALCAAATSLPMLLTGRAIQGIAGALMIPGALSILTHAFPEAGGRARVIGGWSSFSALALIAGPILGGLLVDHVGWPSIFLINLPIGLLTLALGIWGISESAHPAHAAFDPAGQLLSVLWLGSLTYALITAGQHGWLAPAALVPLVTGIAGLGVFLFVERKAVRPLLPLSLFANPSFSVINFGSFVLGFSAYSNVFFLSLFFQQVQGWPPLLTGWALAPQFACMALFAYLFGRIAPCIGLQMSMIAGYSLIGMATLMLCTLSAQTAYAWIGLLLGLLGAGMGLAIPASSAAVMTTVPRERSGMASATTNAIRQTGMTLGIALLASIMASGAGAHLTAALAQAGISDSGQAARRLISQGGDAAVAGVDPTALHNWFVPAYLHGFHLAMACAGAMALAAAVLLLRLRWLTQAQRLTARPEH